MKPNTILLTAISLIILVLCINTISSTVQHSNLNLFPEPKEGEENEKLRQLYNELRHKAAPGVTWQEIEQRNRQRLISNISFDQKTATASYANGAIYGDWYERGANNQAGSIRAVDYVPASNTLYTVSNGGTLWSSTLGSGAWTLLNQAYMFDGRIMKAFTKTGGGTRLLVANGLNIYYSDNNGATITPATGITFPVAWGGNYIASLVRLNDATNTIYCLTRPWSSSPWGARFWLYRSIDQGQTFSKIHEFTFGDDNRLSMVVPYNISSAVYLAEIGSTPGSIKTYSVSGTTVTLLNTYATGITPGNLVLKGTFSGAVMHLYALVDNNKVYKSINNGLGWTLQSNLPEDAWNRMNVSPTDPTKVCYGGVNAYRSTTSGASWTKVNNWSEYYTSVADKLHADIMELEYFTKSDNTEFLITDCHGGTYVSYNHLVNVTNLSVTSHIAVEYYDVLTDTLNRNRIFAGSQDQGLQRTLTGTAAGIQNFTQVISGDYGHMCLTYNNQFLWPQYPGGQFYNYTNLGNANASYIGSWTMGGTQKSNAGWMLPSISTANLAANEIWVGGGNINGGGGSYVAKATMLTSSPYTVSATQFNYDFRANSRTTSAGVTTIEQSLINTNKLYVATEDGTFFYSTNLGSSWNKTASFIGPYPWWLYGAAILASRVNSNVVWYGGSGYSNPAVYKSTDGGVTFNPMSTGLPATLVNEIAATPNEAFLFAATEAGPYVYVTATNTWYTLTGANCPVQNFTNVEYIRADSIVRFGTMGRGIWDFKIAPGITYTFTGDGNWNVAGNWANNAIPPSPLPNGSIILINPIAGGECVLNVPQVINSGGRVTVTSSKKFRVNGNLSIQ